MAFKYLIQLQMQLQIRQLQIQLLKKITIQLRHATTDTNVSMYDEELSLIINGEESQEFQIHFIQRKSFYTSQTGAERVYYPKNSING